MQSQQETYFTLFLGTFSIDQKVGCYFSFRLLKIRVIDITENIYSNIWLFVQRTLLLVCVVFYIVNYYLMKEIIFDFHLETFSNMDGNIFKIIWHDR